MPNYLVERHLPNFSGEQLSAAAAMAKATTSQSFTSQGKEVRYIRSTYLPGESPGKSNVMCLFEAQSSQLVSEVNEAANITFTRIVEAMDLTP